MRTSYRMVALLALLPLLILGAGCSKPGLEYIPTGGSYTMDEAQAAAVSTSLEAVKGVKTADAPALRTKRLEQLRTEGPEASALADLLTKDFPSETAAVPLRIESATIDGDDCWLVIEAWGDENGVLTHRRLWIIDRATLEITGSSSFR
ncbi:MAG: hypothetical protein D9V44_05610 [Actinobacteria bacterium]|nr:MAG: hypothetical protein D9V44_05610 [Actinomycetota bacterium]